MSAVSAGLAAGLSGLSAFIGGLPLLMSGLLSLALAYPERAAILLLVLAVAIASQA